MSKARRGADAHSGAAAALIDSRVAFIRNATVNLLNAHYAIRAFAGAAGGAFLGAYLLHSGVPAPGVLAAFAAILLTRFALRPLVLMLAKRLGLKPLVIVGAALNALQFLAVGYVHGIGLSLVVFCLVFAIGDLLYWTSYHAYFAALGDREHRGHQLGAREAIGALIGIIAPLCGAWTIATIGPSAAFMVVAAIQISSALPLLSAPNVEIAREAPGAFRAALPGMAIFAANGMISAGIYNLWPIVLFVTLSQSFTAFGGAMAFAALIGAAASMLLGRDIDLGRGSRAVMLALGAMACMIALRAASMGHPVMAVFANAFGSFATCLYGPTLMAAIYNSAKAAPCPLRFHIATESVFDLTASATLLIAAGAVALGAPLPTGMLISLCGAGAVYVLLQRYYAPRAAAAIA